VSTTCLIATEADGVPAPRIPRQRAMWPPVLPTLRSARTLPGVDSTLTTAAIGVGGTVIVGVAGFWASVRNTNKTTALTLRALELTEQGQVTDRYTKAVGQLGDESSPVRIGGIYALERIGNDSPKDRTTIIYVLGAFIRERSRVPERDEQPPEDVMAGIRVVGRLLPPSEVKLNLRGADLRNTDMSDLPEDQVLLEGANLDGAKLPRPHS
jgi:hypothetical protein